MDIEFKFIGWNKTDGHDKVWTAFVVGDAYYAGWGRRGQAIRFKYYGRGYYGHDRQDTMIQKKSDTYNLVEALTLFTLFPTFKDDVATQLSSAIANKRIPSCAEFR